MSRSRLVARNFLATLATQLVSWGLTFVVTLFLPRYLKDTGLGIITLAGSFALIFSVFVVLGTSTVLVKEIARDRSRTSDLVTAALAIRIPLGVVAIGLGWVAAYVLAYEPSVRLLVFLSLVAMAFAQVNDVFSSALKGLEDFPRQNAAALLEKLIVSGLTIVLVFIKAPLWAFGAVALLGTLPATLFNFRALRPHLTSMQLPSWLSVSTLVKGGMPFLTTAIFIAIYGQSDSLLLSKLSSLEAIGWYGLAKRLGGTTMVIPVALTSTLLPTLTRLHNEDAEAFRAAIQRLFDILLVCVVPFAAILILAPGQILALLNYPESFRNAIPVLVIMGSAIILWYLSQVVGTALIASDRQVVFSRITGVSALACIPLCSVSIYITQRLFNNGAIGAMASDVLIEGYMVWAYINALPKGTISLSSLSILLRAGIAALPLIAMFYLVREQSHLYVVVLGVLVYLSLCWMMRCIHPKDVQMVQTLFRRPTRA